MGDTYPHVRVAVAQATAPFLNREAAVKTATAYIEDAGQQGVDLLAFPEGFIPAHPTWYAFHPAVGPKSIAFAVELFKNAVEVPGPATDALCTAAARARVNVVMGLCEKNPKSTGTMYNTQLFVGRNGRLLGKHRKIMPTLGERLVHTGGGGDGLRVVETDIGSVSGLICGENSNPLAIFALASQHTQIHVAGWPCLFSRKKNAPGMADAVSAASRGLAYTCKCFVLNACGIVTDEMREVLPCTAEDREFLADPKIGGSSSIVGPDGTILAGPMDGSQSGLLIADIDLEDCVRGKLYHDFAGHYNRPDIFTVRINTSAPAYLQMSDGGPEPGEPSPGAGARPAPGAMTGSSKVDVPENG